MTTTSTRFEWILADVTGRVVDVQFNDGSVAQGIFSIPLKEGEGVGSTFGFGENGRCLRLARYKKVKGGVAASAAVAAKTHEVLPLDFATITQILIQDVPSSALQAQGGVGTAKGGSVSSSTDASLGGAAATKAGEFGRRLQTASS